jgi:hypothetical protein
MAYKNGVGKQQISIGQNSSEHEVQLAPAYQQSPLTNFFYTDIQKFPQAPDNLTKAVISYLSRVKTFVSKTEQSILDPMESVAR